MYVPVYFPPKKGVDRWKIQNSAGIKVGFGTYGPNQRKAFRKILTDGNFAIHPFLKASLALEGKTLVVQVENDKQADAFSKYFASPKATLTVKLPPMSRFYKLIAHFTEQKAIAQITKAFEDLKSSIIR